MTTASSPARKPRVVLGFSLLMAALLIFFLAIVIGFFLDEATRAQSSSSYALATVFLPILAAVLYVPMLITSVILAIRALRIRRSTPMAWWTVCIGAPLLVPAAWLSWVSLMLWGLVLK